MTTALEIGKRTGSRLAGETPLRVLLVTEASSAGVGRHFLDLAEGLAQRGCRVTAIYSPLRSDSIFRERAKALGEVRFYELPFKRSIHPLDAWSALQLYRAARKLGPFDVAHGHSSKGGALVRLALPRLGIPTVYTPHAFVTLNPHLGRAKRFAYGRIERLLAAMGRGRLIAVCPAEREHAVGLGIPRSNVRLVYNGQTPAALPPRDVARRKLGIEDEWLVLGFVGRLSPQKRPDRMIDAFAAAARVQPLARLAMIGTGPLEAELRRQAQRLGVHDKIFWLGNVDGRMSMPAFDVFCLPALYDVTPYVVLEALEAGLPIVVTDVGIVDDAVRRSGAGIVVPVGDPAAFNSAVVQVATDAALRSRLAAAAAAQGNPYTVDAMVEGTLAVYRELVTPAGSC